MKKVIFSFILIFCLSVFPACKKECEYRQKFSQLRQTALYAEKDSYSLVCYPEIRENPYLDDGKQATLENCLIFKLTFKGKHTDFENCKISFSVDKKEYCGEFEFKPLSSFLYCYLKVDSLPSACLFVNISYDGKSDGFELKPLKKATTISYCDAIEKLKTQDDSAVGLLNSNNEMRVRYISSGDYDYWYLGFIGKDCKVSFLIDGETGELVAKKDGL